jgi:hypothetical protein
MNPYTILVGELEERKKLGRHGHRCEDDIKINCNKA